MSTCGGITVDYIDAGPRSGFGITSVNPISKGGGCSSGSCGDGSCDPGEENSCQEDCGVGTGKCPTGQQECPDGTCKYYCGCPNGQTLCPDGTCKWSCDGTRAPYCGDMKCDPGETPENCQDDCGTPCAQNQHRCNDGTCKTDCTENGGISTGDSNEKKSACTDIFTGFRLFDGFLRCD